MVLGLTSGFTITRNAIPPWFIWWADVSLRVEPLDDVLAKVGLNKSPAFGGCALHAFQGVLLVPILMVPSWHCG